ncbi:MAG: TetR/AcrR family transcriptional regulator [Nitrospira sp.]|nr:TetR/AcrR family transcriptional regulator [Nitrospira sp.]
MKMPIDKTLSHRPSANRVISAARKQFFAHGFRTVRMDDIAAELGMSKKTLYAHFPSKTALVQTIMQEKFSEVEADLSRLKSTDEQNVETALRNLLDCVQRHTAEIQPPFVRDIGRELPELFQIIEKRRRDLIRHHFGELFKQGQRTGLIRKDIPVLLIIESLLGAVQAIMNPPKLAELGLTVETGYLSIIRIILEGALHNQRNR